MSTTFHRRGGRRITRAVLAVTAFVTLAGVGAPTAQAQPALTGACAEQKNKFDAAKAETRFWIRAMDRLAAAGNEASADVAADYVREGLGEMRSALEGMKAACGR